MTRNLLIVDKLSPSDKIVIFGDDASDFVGIPFSIFQNAVNAASIKKINQDFIPLATGFEVTVQNRNTYLQIRPTGTLASGTIKLPQNAIDCVDVTVLSTQEITALVLDGQGALVSNGPSTIAANGYFTLRYHEPTKTWRRVG